MAGGEPDALDPTTLRLISGVEVFRTICERLYDFDSKSRVVPQLAASLPTISKDGRTYTIKLRKGVIFNDRTRFDAQSVVTSLQRHQTLPGSLRASNLSPVDSITAVGRYTVVLHLSKPFFAMLNALAGPGGMIMSRAQLAKLGANFAQEPICVGAFMYDNRVAGDSITVVRSPYYYDKKRVHLDKIVFKIENDAAAAVAALKAGDLDALDRVSATSLRSVRSTSRLRLLKRASTGYQSITFNMGNKNGVGSLPYQNIGTQLATSPSLRKAFDLAIDRKATGKVVLAGEMLPDCSPVS